MTLGPLGIFGIVGIVLGCFALISVYHSMNVGYSCYFDKLLGTLTGLFAGIVVFTCLMLLGLIPHHLWGKKTVEDMKVDIVSANDQSYVNGSGSGFLVLSCRIDEVDYFTFYKQTDTNSFQKEKIPSYETIIHEINNSNELPRVEWKMKKKHSVIWGGDYTSEKLDGEYHLYVPKGSVQREFTLQ